MIFNFDELTDEQLEEYVEDFKKLPLKYFDYFPLVELFRKYYKTGFRDKEFATNMNHLLTALNWEINRRQSNGWIKKLGYGKNHFLTCIDLEESTLIKKLNYAESRMQAYSETFSKSMCNEKHIKIIYEKIDELVEVVNKLIHEKTESFPDLYKWMMPNVKGFFIDIDKEVFPITIVGHPREKENGIWKILVRDNTSMDFLDVNCLYVLETNDAL